MKKVFSLFCAIIIVATSFAQDSFRKSFTEANQLMEENFHSQALPIWLSLTKDNPENYNINYKIGICYLYSPNQKKLSKDYLVKAVQGVTKNYDPFSYNEKKSPMDAHYYLGWAYHLTNNIDEAIAEYNKFLEAITDKHYLYDEAQMRLIQCNNAKEAIKNPVQITATNLGSKINTEYPDYSPVISVDERLLFFTSRRLRNDSSNLYTKDDGDGGFFEDIYVSYKEDNNEWGEPELVPNLNTSGHEATINLSKDGQTLFIYKDDDGDGNLYMSTLDGDIWSTPVKLGSNINETSYETHADISLDGNIIYFTSDRKGGKGGMDIYFCKKLPNGQWALAQNMGDAINTKFDEDGIFMHPDGKTMYFSSNGPNSIGGFDIFYTEWDDNLKTWGAPINLGYPINTTDDDVFFITTPDGQRAYYTAFREDGFGEKDIYMLDLSGQKEKDLTLLVGRIEVVGYDELPENARIVVTDNNTGETVGIYKPRKKDGRFSIIIPPGSDYHFLYESDPFSYEEDIYVPEGSGYQEIDRGINLKPIIFGTRPKGETNNAPIANADQYTTLKNAPVGGNVAKNDKDPDGDAMNVNTKLVTKAANGSVTMGKDGDFSYTPKADFVGTDEFVYEICDIYEPSKCSNAKVTIVINDNQTVNNNNTNNNNTNNNSNNNNTNTNVSVSQAYYEKFYEYNAKGIRTSEESFKKFLSDCEAIVKAKGKITITIESSASKVPTSSYADNKDLATKRANDARDLFVKSLKSKGLKDEQIQIGKLNSMVQGPDYKNDFKENRLLYEKFQYVKIWAK